MDESIPRPRDLLIAPTMSTGRWDDPGYEHPSEDGFGAMKQVQVDGRYGFVFHEACWSLLEKASHSCEISHHRLFDVCRSLPFPMQSNALSWGHAYNGLVLVDTESSFPWEDRENDREYPEPDPIFSSNPFDSEEAEQLIAEIEQSPPQDSTSQPPINTRYGRDCFSKLPQELCSAIAMQLSTVDALNARLASRTFGHIYYSQQFWATRFQYGSERSWMFESSGKQVHDWRWLYRRTSSSRLGPVLQNRQRIWNLAHRILDILKLAWIDSPRSISRPHSSIDSSGAVQVSGDLSTEETLTYIPTFTNGCRLFRNCRIIIPENLTKLSICCIQIGDLNHITGIKFSAPGGESVQIGYWDHIHEESTELSHITGFNLAMGCRGVQSIQCIGELDGTSRWLGFFEDAPRTSRLPRFSHLDELEVGFDGFKMVSLAIRSNSNALAQNVETRAVDNQASLRTSGLWYPSIPPPDLQLNEHLFVPSDYFLDGYKPLLWTHFGGPGGIYLKYLIRISVVWGGDIRRIEFVYSEGSPIESQVLGRYKPHEYAKTADFAIDGPGGELIDIIEVNRFYPENVSSGWLAKHGAFRSFKVSTNRMRSYVFGDRPGPRGRLVSTPLATNAGSVITGLYTSKRPKDSFGFTALGVISEEIDSH
ncbi:hypothetical protein BX600DRAFT_475765 [Xylariales sp. PMI_506]|nr:hypothetical protein BX600DRAFT_475765 [Xylariales sp. PMI_506]